MPTILDQNEIFYKQFEPKVQNRFIMKIDGIESYIVKAASRPTFTSEEIIIDHINVQRKIKGKSTWDTITLTLYDPIVPSGAQQVMEWIRLSHESITGRDGYAAFYKKNPVFQLLGPVGDVVEEWQLIGAFISSANFGDMDWASTSDLVNIELTLSYDYAILEY